jgi:hypothetical protein
MGDMLPKEPLPSEINLAKLDAAVDAAFQPAEGLTAAFVVTWKGRLIAERYGEGLIAQTPLEGWSMGKSITATLLGILVKQGVYELTQPARFRSGKPPVTRALKSASRTFSACRAGCGSGRHRTPTMMRPAPIRITCISTPAASIPITTRRHVRSNGLPTPSDARNSDPVLISHSIRLAVEKRGEDYLPSPQRALFDKLGIRTMVIETTCSGPSGAGL